MAYEDVRQAGISMSARGLGDSSCVTSRAAYAARAAVENPRASAGVGAIARRPYRLWRRPPHWLQAGHAARLAGLTTTPLIA